MRISRFLVLSAVLLATAFAAADTLPDPQLDFLGGTGSFNFTGAMVINFSLDTNGNLQCSTSSFGEVFVPSTTGPGNTCTLGAITNAFANGTGADIMSFHIEFGNVQTAGFSAGAASLFKTVIPDADGKGATYGGGDIAPCVPSALNDCGLTPTCFEGCIAGARFGPTADATLDGPFTEFYLSFTNVELVNGFATATLTSSPLAVS